MHGGGLLTVGRDRTGPPRPRRRTHYRALAVVVILAVVAAGALAWIVTFSSARGPVKPTLPSAARASPLAAGVDPNIVDVTATLGDQQAVSAGPG